jgi:uncharacterized Tic20 family protein
MAGSEQTIEGADGRPLVSQEERNWALVAHLGPIVLGSLSLGVLAFALPLVIFLAKRDESEFVSDQSKESLNFQITVFLAYLVCSPLVLVVIGLLFWGVILVAHIVLGLVAAVKSYEGERYRYPVALRLVS